VDGESVGQALRRWRQRRGLSLRQLGRLVNYSHVYIWEIEKGSKPPTPDFIAACDTRLHACGELVAATAHKPLA
jgi:transcriptional regulator with XRE-family HTH domain